MAVRTTSELVASIIEEDTDVDFTPFIETANALVEKVLVEHYDDETYLELIERWLAAHFYAIRLPRTTQEQVRSISEKFESYVRLALDITRYGQQVRLLDYLGILAGISNQTKPRITATIKHIGGELRQCYTDPTCGCDDEDDDDEDDDDSGTGTGTGTGT